ncbi:MAG: PilZ domain-containing protein [Desulfamplus sp.]|nr:PilZ domain-containing protein [Desulfamplus sp.]
MAESIKIYADEENRGVFVCPHCGFKKEIPSLLNLKTQQNRLNVKCKCAKVINVLIEFRRFFRKDVLLNGSCIVEKSGTKCDIVIKDISLGGVALEFFFVNKKHIKQLEIGDRLMVEFALDNNNLDIVRKKCVVKNINGFLIGAEFLDEEYSSKIGFYLM